MKNYAVRIFVKMPGYKGKTFKGIIKAENPNAAKELVMDRFVEILKENNTGLQKEHIQVKKIELFDHFVIIKDKP